MIEDLQNNVDTLEGGVQVLNKEIAQQCEDLSKARQEADIKIGHLHSIINKLEQQLEEERNETQQKILSSQKQNQETIDHLQRRCNCLTKLFEEVRLRYERRESRQEDLNIIADLRQVIAEQEKDLACINEEKRYFQMRLIALEKSLEGNNSEEEIYQDADQDAVHVRLPDDNSEENTLSNSACALPPYPMASMNGLSFSIPPTIQECDDYDE
ncbi:hypothetical protein HHI36_012770 [Cryptolaemus montrouzieri]|uniref:Uncharacterized protein n=1 Tax=Cryptolaemus montrouzieri TaxID=559131 RepID=A0ABD2NGD9_9CUCU